MEAHKLLKEVCCLVFFIFCYRTIPAQEIKPGSIQRVNSFSDSSNQYSLYLPINYTPGIKYPLVIFLDPMARGNIPVEKYRTIADEEGVILAGSWGSENFNPSGSAISITAILDDLIKRVDIDISKVWLAGFSGGARMASSYALHSGQVSGVIACGAGFPDNDFYTSTKHIPFAGIAGYRDMNFEELLGIKELLSERKKENILLLYDGEHQWPPADQLAMAILWLNKKTLPTPGRSIKEKEGLFRELNKLKEEGLTWLSWLQANEYKKIYPLSATADSMIRVTGSIKGITKNREIFEQVIKEEREYMDEFSFLFSQFVLSAASQAGNDEIWKQKAAKIKLLRENKHPYRQLSGERLFDFSWRLCIEQYEWLMQSKQYRNAYKAATLLSFYPGNNPDPLYLMARAAAGIPDRALCLQHLKEAIKKKSLTREKLLGDRLITNVTGLEELEKLFSN